jgi:hypothetical protein
MVIGGSLNFATDEVFPLIAGTVLGGYYYLKGNEYII